jgi:hypothetical protein
MSSDIDNRQGVDAVDLGGELRLAGWLSVGGLVLNAVSTVFHPAGAEDNHEVIFTQYANSDPWIAVHIGQFVGVLLALGGLLVVCNALRAAGQSRLLSHLAAAAAVATAASWAILQGLDGVGLKQADCLRDGKSDALCRSRDRALARMGISELFPGAAWTDFHARWRCDCCWPSRCWLAGLGGRSRGTAVCGNRGRRRL